MRIKCAGAPRTPAPAPARVPSLPRVLERETHCPPVGASVPPGRTVRAAGTRERASPGQPVRAHNLRTSGCRRRRVPSSAATAPAPRVPRRGLPARQPSGLAAPPVTAVRAGPTVRDRGRPGPRRDRPARGGAARRGRAGCECAPVPGSAPRFPGASGPAAAPGSAPPAGCLQGGRRCASAGCRRLAHSRLPPSGHLHKLAESRGAREDTPPCSEGPGRL